MEKQKQLKGLLISDFNLDNFCGYLNNDENSPLINASLAPFGQILPVLIDKNLECWKKDYDFAVVWSQPESIIDGFKQILEYQRVSIRHLLAGVDAYSQILIKLQKRVRFLFIPAWVLPTYHRGYGMLELKNALGIENILMQMNLRLAKDLKKTPDVYLLNTRKWIEVVGKNAFNPKLWYMAKIPFDNEVFKEATRDIKSALNAISGRSRKIIVIDLDDTLWGGIVGDIGWQNINLGGHDHIGEAYLDFQRSLKALTNRGILLSIVSKNDESIALEAIRNHPEMLLKLDDFAGWRINWEDKARNIIDLISELNLDLQSVVFIDDNPVERARIREVLPEVLVPEWPEDKMLYKKALLSLNCFEAPTTSKEDLLRAEMYATERQRRDLKNRLGSLDEWLKTLEIKVVVERLNEHNLQRAAQLLNKTNQMNLSTRRLSESELINWASQDNRTLWTFRVSDKFGDSGLTGIISLELEDKKAKIIDFILSCRVIGRKIEETMLYVAIDYGRTIGLNEIYVKYIPTLKNKPCLEFWKGSGFAYNQTNDSFKWDFSSNYLLPECIEIRGAWNEKQFNATDRYI